MRDPSTPRVFVSYSRKDGLEFARRLQTVLEAEGLSLYRDLSDLEGGEDWWRQVEAAIRSVEHVVLVLSPAALLSPYVTREWKLARQEGRKVSPVSGPGVLDFSHLPRWMERAHRHDIDIPESLGRLVQVLKGPAGERRVPFMADALPEGYVARPKEFEALKRSLLDARGEPVAITAALRGAGGYGKTALANALCHDNDVQNAFSDGILRITLGEKPDDLVGRIADLIETISGARPGFQAIDPAKAALADALDDRRCLLVIDDAWRVQDLAPFLHRGAKDQTTRLVTTRDDSILPRDAARVPVDAMKSDEAQELLSRSIPTALAVTLRPRLAALAARLGEWPLLLGLANGIVRDRMRQGAHASDALGYAERAIAQRGIGTAFRPDDRDSRRRTAWGTVEVSLEQLDADERSRFAELGVFVEDAEIPIDVATGLWHRTAALSSLDGEDLLGRLAALSLLWEFDLSHGVLRLHDVVRAMIREHVLKGRLAELDNALVDHFRHVSHGDLSKVTDLYGVRHLLAHLIGAGQVDAACALLVEPRWLLNKIQCVGIQPLLHDYTILPQRNAALDLIAAALTLAAPAVAGNPGELAPQLLARLAQADAAGLDDFLARARDMIVPPMLVPSRPSFTPPGAELRRFECRAEVCCVTALGDGRRALSGSVDGTLRLWDLESGAELRRFQAPPVCSRVTVLADGRRALSGSSDGTLRLWDLESGVELRRFKGDAREIRILTVAGDGGRALSGDEWMLQLWDLESGAELRRFEAHSGGVLTVTMLGDGRRALSGSVYGTLRLWDLESGAELRRFEGHKAPVRTVEVLGHGRYALSGSFDGTLRLWDVATGAELRVFQGHSDTVTSVTMVGDGRCALSGSFDGTLRLWDVATGAELRVFKGHSNIVTSVTVLGDGRHALSGSSDGTLRLWDLERGAELRRRNVHVGTLTSVTVLDDGRRALCGSSDGMLRLLEIESGAEVRRFQGHAAAVTSVTVLDDGRCALTSSDDGTLRLWDLERGAELRRIEAHPGGGFTATMLRDGQRALSGAGDWTVRLWDLESGAELRRFEAPGWVSSVAMLGDGRRALSGSGDSTLQLWDLESGVEVRRLHGHEAGVRSVTVLSDGRRALSGSSDGTMRLWDLESGVELRRFEGHQASVETVTVLGHQRYALSASDDGTLRLWDLESGAEVARLTFDVTFHAIGWSPQRDRLVIADGRGDLHVIELVE